MELYNKWVRSVLVGSVVYIIGEPLVSVVVPCAVTVDRLLDDPLHSIHQLFIRGSFVESTSQGLPVELLEALHIFTVGHHLHPLHDISFIVADEFESEEKEVFKVEKDIWVGSIHKFKVIFGQFEGSFFETKISRRAADDEAEVYMYDMSVVVYKNVIVMPVFNLKEILNHWISRQTLNKVWHTGFPVVSKELFVDIPQTRTLRFLLQVADSPGVLDKFYEAAFSIKGDNSIGTQPYLDVFFVADLFNHADELHGHVLLP